MVVIFRWINRGLAFNLRIEHPWCVSRALEYIWSWHAYLEFRWRFMIGVWFRKTLDSALAVPITILILSYALLSIILPCNSPRIYRAFLSCLQCRAVEMIGGVSSDSAQIPIWKPHSDDLVSSRKKAVLHMRVFKSRW
jgi:hypothetical protein